ncbi:uncharacterized protein CCOS01_02468 [Colletotrichum costaricense]|uniref:Uncharacterized protein n=1 Tax=Colletotrichum costaricense TaxID=1209916 RepID=A0AAI9Z7G9_9PEZI|nr:uncharacterized protein CCOS01_02468 [Colletotrichum costaricense]KAK1537148.1 hypothetical protein CCOS01_02468 [Colletotrichum costaricense]
MVRRRSVPGFGDCLSSAHGVSWPNRQANRLILADTARRIKKARGDHAHGAVVVSDCIPAAKLGSNAMSMPLLSIPGGISRAVVTGQGMGETASSYTRSETDSRRAVGRRGGIHQGGGERRAAFFVFRRRTSAGKIGVAARKSGWDGMGYVETMCLNLTCSWRILALDSQGGRVASKDEDLRMPFTIFGAETGKDPDKEDSW